MVNESQRVNNDVSPTSPPTMPAPQATPPKAELSWGFLAVVAIAVWLLFFGGYGTITGVLTPPAPVTVYQTATALPSGAGVSNVANPPIATPNVVAVPANPPADVPSVVPTIVPTVAPTNFPTATSMPADVPQSELTNVHTDIHPDGSFTIDNGAIRYYPDTSGRIVDLRLPGIDDYQPTPAAATATPVVQPLPTRSGPASPRGGHPRR